ncbi:MAG: hypothetical protein IKW87_12570 [Ruminococcus sp.]|nr:hypothetical protein [Ruminococcus sp.]
MAETDELYSFVSRTSAESPDMKLFVLSYVKSYPMRRRLEMLGVAGFYPMLAEPMGTTPTGAEQVLRRFGKRMQNEGRVFGDKGGKSMTANKYMISSAIDEFMSKYYHYE